MMAQERSSSITALYIIALLLSMPPCSLGTLANMPFYRHSRVPHPELSLLFKLLSHVPCSSVTLLLLPSGPLRVSNPLLTDYQYINVKKVYIFTIIEMYHYLIQNDLKLIY